MEMPTTFSDLPFDCVKLIFNLVRKKDLATTSLVSHYFLHLTNKQVQVPDLLYETIPLNNTFSKLLQRFRNLKRLSLHCSPRFDLAGTLDQIADSGLNLEFLSITSCCDRIDPFPREPLIRISSNMPNLRSICCRYLARDDYDLIALAEIFPELEDLDLSCCSINMSEVGIENALTRFHKLRRIDLSCNKHLHLSEAWLFSHLHLSEAWLFSLANCPLLKEVECIFSGGYGRTDIGVCALLCGCPKLMYVLDEDIRLDMINFPLFMAVVYEAKNLRYLEINDMTMVDKEYRGDREVSAAQIRKAFVLHCN